MRSVDSGSAAGFKDSGLGLGPGVILISCLNEETLHKMCL